MRALGIISIVFGWLVLLLELVAIAMAGLPTQALLSLDNFLMVVLPFLFAIACVWFCMATLRLHRLAPAVEVATLDRIDIDAQQLRLPPGLRVLGVLSLLGAVGLGMVVVNAAQHAFRQVLSRSYLFGMGWLEAAVMFAITLVCIAIVVYTARTLTMKMLDKQASPAT